ncbi:MULTISPECIES: hypothetical protein [Flavobacterium]|uniref:Auto-transporter adhesin head GIN domain-containing protein n=1 Tax=Flavobacterium jumunjinense TaxID=998845 RepID=A0ABV5GPK9_9FLAO|nr:MULTISPECIES: hypothetical protein [Flavobacterium]
MAILNRAQFRVVLNGASACVITSDEVKITVTLGTKSFESSNIKVYHNLSTGIFVLMYKKMLNLQFMI